MTPPQISRGDGPERGVRFGNHEERKLLQSSSGDGEVAPDSSRVPRKRVLSKNGKIGERFGEVARQGRKGGEYHHRGFQSRWRRPPASAPSASRFVVVVVPVSVVLLWGFYLLSREKRRLSLKYPRIFSSVRSE